MYLIFGIYIHIECAFNVDIDHLCDLSLKGILLYQLDNSSLRFCVRLDVALRGRQVRMPRQHLDIPQRPAHRRDLPGSAGDEGPTPGVARTAREPKIPIPTREHVHHRLRRSPTRSLSGHHER